MVARISAPADGVILDVATGTASVTARLAERTGARVMGADLIESMVRRGATNVRQHQLGGRVHYCSDAPSSSRLRTRPSMP
jgi:ubiquinone/menaquinone biosynthesis C-methylase UbiE